MSDKQKLISVIIPVYNTAEYLTGCLDSVINNDYKNLEIICVNDGSTDSSPEILRRYEKNDSRIKVIDVPNGGVSRARNIGLDNASGEYIAFIDSDDRVHRQYFSILTHLKNKYNADIVSVLYDSTDHFKQDSAIDFDSITCKSFLGDDALNNVNIRWIVWGKLFDRSVVCGNRFTDDISYGEDTIFMIEQYLGNKTIKTVLASTKLYYYFNRNTSASNENIVIKNIALCKLFLEKVDCLENKKSAWPYVADSIRRCLAYRLRACQNEAEKKYLPDIERILKQNSDFERKYRCLPFWKSKIYRMMIRYPKLFEMYRGIRKR